MANSLPSFKSLLRCDFLNETYPENPVENFSLSPLTSPELMIPLFLFCYPLTYVLYLLIMLAFALGLCFAPSSLLSTIIHPVLCPTKLLSVGDLNRSPLLSGLQLSSATGGTVR